jgi:hypothetical protein
MAERKAVTKTMARRYQQASRAAKTGMLDELCALTGWTRDHARRALRVAVSAAGTKTTRAPRPRIYGEEVAEPLRMIWATLNGPSGKRLAPFMAEIVEVLERHGEIEVDPAVRDKLLRVSAATIDRMLAGERTRLDIRGRSGTKPGTLLKQQIPIRTFADWDDARPGFCETDLVAHDGGNPAGEFCQTLDLTCVATGWTEMRALQNKAQRWCFEALQDIERTLPFPLLGLDSDNGSEFINNQLYRWCMDQEITFTRSRPQRKNDNCFVEQKNFPVVRQQVGYLRYDTPAELDVLTELYTHLRLYVNFFQPQMRWSRRSATGRSSRGDTIGPAPRIAGSWSPRSSPTSERRPHASLPRAEPRGAQARDRPMSGSAPQARRDQGPRVEEGGGPQQPPVEADILPAPRTPRTRHFR